MFVKLFHTILKSSVWEESLPTRIVWITFLLEADEDGMVRGIEDGLARAANVTLEEFRAAVTILEGPDLRSQSQEWGGRRIEKVEGGWQVLNYTKYREYRTRAQVKEAEKKRRQRAKSSDDNGLRREDAPPTAPVPGHVPDVPTNASVSSSVPAVPEIDRQKGEHLNWCSDCGGRKEWINKQPHLRHLEWCPRRTG